jgi:DNA-binding transcriptional ArsR family regulator
VTDQILILAPQTVRVRFAVEPVLNATDSLLLLSSYDNQSGFPDWVRTTKAHLSPELAHQHDVLMKGIKIIDHEPRWPSFPAYLDHLAAMDPVTLRDKAIEWMCIPDKLTDMGLQPLPQADLLDSREAYIDLQRQVWDFYREQHGDKDFGDFDADLYAEVHALLTDPARLHELAVTHFRFMWDTILAPEWARVLPMLEEAVQAFEQLDFSGQTALEAIRTVTGRDLTGVWDEELHGLAELVFVPSAHIGPYVRLFTFKEQQHGYLIFGARLPEGTQVKSPALSRSELLVRLSALADDTRLQILELLVEQPDLCAQDIMTQLNLSQSSASRHLRQLTANGYLIERRREVAKCYSLNPDRVADTLAALRRFLKTT